MPDEKYEKLARETVRGFPETVSGGDGEIRKAHICRFDSTEHITGKNRTYEAVKAAVLEAGRFSCFEASNGQNAPLFTRLCRDPEVETSHDLGFPWTRVWRRHAG